MIATIIGFLVMLNPFALFLYLAPIMKELSNESFRKVLFKASLISYIIYLVFMVIGDFLFRKVFMIHFESFRMFGGIVIFSYAYFYIVKGQKALVQMKADLDDLASEIALPFMVGAGTISLSILMSYDNALHVNIIALALIMVVNYIIIMILKDIRGEIEKKKYRIAFDKHMEVMLRLMGFFIGAIGINMMITALMNIFF